jgi:hypothetical protein
MARGVEESKVVSTVQRESNGTVAAISPLPFQPTPGSLQIKAKFPGENERGSSLCE